MKLDYERYFFSKTTIFVLLSLLLTSCLSFFISLSEKQEWIYILNYDTDPNLNREAVTNVINNYTGFQFLYNLWFNSFGLDMILMIVLISWIGVSFTPRMQIEKENGFGNLVLTRLNYRIRFHQILAAQSLYIISVLFLYVFFSVILALIFGGFPITAFEYGEQQFGLLEMFGIVFLQFIWLSLVVITINAYSSVCNLWMNSRYSLQIFPFVVFVIVPVLAGTIVGNLFPTTASILMFYQPEVIVLALSFLFQSDATIWNFLQNSAIFITALLSFLLIYSPYIKKYSEDYL